MLKQSSQPESAHLKSWKKTFYRRRKHHHRATREFGSEKHFGVRVPLRFFFSFRLNENNPRDFLQINSSINSKDFDIKFVIITSSESILILNWNRQSRKTRIWQRKAFLVLEYLCDFSSHFVQTKITPAIFYRSIVR